VGGAGSRIFIQSGITGISGGLRCCGLGSSINISGDDGKGSGVFRRNLGGGDKGANRGILRPDDEPAVFYKAVVVVVLFAAASAVSATESSANDSANFTDAENCRSMLSARLSDGRVTTADWMRDSSDLDKVLPPRGLRH